MPRPKTKIKPWIETELRKSFATTPDRELADLFGVSYQTVRRYAEKLGLHKSPEYIRAQHTTLYIHRKSRVPKSAYKKGHKPTHGFQKGYTGWNCKPCINLTTMQTYPSISEAGRATGRDMKNICRACKTGYRSGGDKWMYLDQYKRIQERIRNKPKWSLTREEREMLSRTKPA